MPRRCITSRTGPLALLAVGLACGLLGLGCGGPSERETVASLVESSNEVLTRAAPALRQANGIYARFAQGRLSGAEAVGALEENEKLIASLRSDVAELQAPAQARRLKALVLAVFDANADVAEETTVTARYLVDQRRALSALNELGEELRRTLRSGAPERQARGLGRYARGLTRPLERLRRLSPPLILEAEHRLHVRRLLDSRALAHRLRSAVLARDEATVVRLLERLGDVNLREPDERLARSARRRYARLLRHVERAQRKAQAELVRLDRSLD